MLGFSPHPHSPTRHTVPAYELDLIAAAQRGDTSAFNQLVRAHQDLVYRLAFHLLDDAHKAERVTQSTFETAYRRIRTCKGEEFRIWVLRIVLNGCKQSAVGRTPGTPSTTFSPVDIGLAALSWDERVICVLSDVLGVREDEIARITNGSVNTIRATRGRARRQIRDVLQLTGRRA